MSKMIEISNGHRRAVVVDTALAFWQRRGWKTAGAEVEPAAVLGEGSPDAPSAPAPRTEQNSALADKGALQAPRNSEGEGGDKPKQVKE